MANGGVELVYPEMNEFRDLSGLGKDNGAESFTDAFGEEPGRGEIGAPLGIQENHVLPGFRSAGGLDHYNFLLDKIFTKCFRIGNGGGEKHKLGIGPIITAQPPQPSDDLAQVASEDAPVGVDLVQDNEREVFEQGFPSSMVRQNAPVQHVGVGEKDVGWLLADLFSLVGRGVAIIDGGIDGQAFNLLKPF